MASDPPQQNGSNGAGSHEPHDSQEGSEAEPESEAEALPAPPPQVAELVAACMRFVASKYKVALDGTPDTLSLVDQYIREARTAFEARPESIDLVAPAVGAYLGEVMRQEFAAEWFAEGSHEAWRLYFHNVFLSFNPVGIAREAITMKDEEGWNAHLTLDPAEREIIDATARRDAGRRRGRVLPADDALRRHHRRRRDPAGPRRGERHRRRDVHPRRLRLSDLREPSATGRSCRVSHTT